MVTEKRDDYFQGIRGLCIIMVVLIHCMTGLDYEQSGVLQFNYDYWIVFRQFINFPVAVFFFLSGYFVKYKKIPQNAFKLTIVRGGGH